MIFLSDILQLYLCAEVNKCSSACHKTPQESSDNLTAARDRPYFVLEARSSRVCTEYSQDGLTEFDQVLRGGLKMCGLQVIRHS